jgi:hypothetical protein
LTLKSKEIAKPKFE